MKNKKKNWEKNNQARFVCCMTLFWPNGKSYSSQGVVNGRISIKRRGKNGFGYDPIFIPKNYSKTFAEMDYKEKLIIDHRFKAYQKIVRKIKDYFSEILEDAQRYEKERRRGRRKTKTK